MSLGGADLVFFLFGRNWGGKEPRFTELGGKGFAEGQHLCETLTRPPSREGGEATCLACLPTRRSCGL